MVEQPSDSGCLVDVDRGEAFSYGAIEHIPWHTPASLLSEGAELAALDLPKDLDTADPRDR